MADALSSPSAALGLRPFSTGELVDHVFRLYRRHFIPLFYFSAMVQFVPFALGLVLEVFDHDASLTDIPTHPELALWFFGSYAASFLLLTLGEGALTHYVARLYLGQEVTVRDGLAAMMRRSGAIVWSTVLKCFFIFLAFLPSTIPLVIEKLLPHPVDARLVGILFLVALFLFMPWIILAMRYLIVIPAVMLEKKSGRKALRRSSEIIRYDPPGLGFFYWGETRISILLLVVGAADLLVAAVSRTPLLVAGAQELLRGTINLDAMSLSPALSTITHLMTFLGSSLIAPLYVIAYTLFYYDFRVRKEALDIELLTASLTTPTRP